MSFFDANEYCLREYGTTLITIFHAQNNNKALEECQLRGGNCWIGYYNSQCETTNSVDFTWLSNPFFNGYTNWANGQPDGNGCCTIMNVIAGTWNDIPCDRERHALCGVCGTYQPS